MCGHEAVGNPIVEMYSTGLPTLDAREDFARARRAARVGRWRAGRWRRQSRPRNLAGPPFSARPPRRATIALDAIVGTVEPCIHFDARFRPLSEHVRPRWERIALASRTGVSLPPITVVQGADGYYVEDGCHRVSVARAAGVREIDAWVR
jgi:hypothetical protein